MMEPGTYANLEIDIELKNRTEQDNIYETLQHGTGELADKTTPSAKKCTPLLFWCTLINSILIGLLIIAVSVSLYMCINVSKASNSKESIKSIAADVRNIRNDLENKTSGLDNLMVITDEINKKCEDGLSDLSKNLERQTNDLRSFSTDFDKQKNVLEDQKKEIEDLRQDINNKSSEIAAIKVNKKHPLVAFNVYGTDPVYTGTKVPFKNIRLNVGGGFNTTTSMFTAPVSGLYQFNAHICIEKAVETDYYLQVGDIKLARGEYVVPNAATDGKCMSISSVALVIESQTAYVGGISSSASFVNNNDFNSFSGVLIRAT